MSGNQNKSKKSRSRSPKENEQQSLKQKAIRYKAFQHTFSARDFNKDFSERKILLQLQESKLLEHSYLKYLKQLEKNPNKRIIFPWENPLSRFIFLLNFWIPQILGWAAIVVFCLLTLNTIPGPTKHIVEFLIARSIYDTAPIHRLPASLESYAHSAKIVGSDGSLIKSYGKREVTKEIPEKVKIALLACEDHNLMPHDNKPWYINSFFTHAGVSWLNLAGAVKDTLQGNTRGASTIIMQNAKKILHNEERTISNKLEEIIISYMLVSKFGKGQNLNFYINTVPVGNNMYGFTAASQNYFKKDLEDLTLQQLVTIGAFIPNHNRQLAFYQIVRGKSFEELSSVQLGHARQAINKINLALSYLLTLDEITSQQFEKWRITDEESIRQIGFREFRSPLYGEEEWASWNVIREVCSRSYIIDDKLISGEELILDLRGDVVVETSVDLSLVEKSKATVAGFLSSSNYRKTLKKSNKKLWKNDLARYQKKNLTAPYSDFKGFMANLHNNVNAGIIIINQKGEIISYVGGKEFLKGENEIIAPSGERKPVIIDLMNKKATLVPASTMKPVIAYFAMTAENANLQTLYTDKPMEYKYSENAGKKIWLPRNWYPYDKEGQGKNRYLGRKYSLLEAQVLSVNTIFSRLYSDRQIRNSLLGSLDRIDLPYDREDAKYWPFGIGASSLPVQPWLGVYNSFLDGVYRQPSFVTRITVNGKEVYTRSEDAQLKDIALFDSRKEREAEMQALYQVCNRGTGAAMKSEFTFHKNLVSGKTGTAPQGKSSVFISHFNPYRDRKAYQHATLTMIVLITTNKGGINSVGNSTEGPVKIAGRIYDYLFKKELQEMMDREIETAKQNNPHFRNNHLYWANVDRYMKRLFEEKSGGKYIHDSIIGVEAYQEALQQILNSNNQIYTGRDDLFEELVRYYMNTGKIARIQ